ncbi:GID8 Glucose-induced degradation protein 8 [Candida maltosa Xu316]|uniref:CTLH domain-containing protein n=1 Tax=Candida maltosa (strain Xu316) TaxID=1245528 RepID=M3JU95_CANMX|nr:hypothetical protein G210_3835 [Candida maltosa Xu316]
MHPSNDKINKLILDYFVQEGYQKAAIQFSKELNVEIDNSYQFNTPSRTTNAVGSPTSNNQFISNINQLNNEKDFSDMVIGYYNNVSKNTSSKSSNHSIDNLSIFDDNSISSAYSTILPRQEIKYLILNGNITEAIKKISQYYPMILDLNNLLHFKLLRLNLVEMIRNHKFNATVNQSERDFLSSILQFVRENLINKVSNSYKLLKELEITMSLLCFKFDPNVKNLQDQIDLPEDLKKIFSLSLRNQCYRLVNQAILKLYNENDTSKFMHRHERLKNDANDEVPDNDDIFDNEVHRQKMTKIYHGPKFSEFDLSKLYEYQAGINDNDEQDEEDDDDDDDDMTDLNEIEYTINKANNLPYKNDEASKSNLSFNNLDNDEEMNKLTNLSLESKLERVIKLWVLTEREWQTVKKDM